MIEAQYYTKLNEGIVQCQLCPHFCTLKQGERGKCGVRENKQGKLFSLVYNRLASYAVDPIEKKPLFHFFPGEQAFSISTYGCNFFCAFCQNCVLSQGMKGSARVLGDIVSAKRVVEMAEESGARIIAYTYSEPTIAFEYYYEIMGLARQRGLRNVFVTNGFINPEPLKKLSLLMDAANIDIKSFSEEFYERMLGGRLKPVLEAIRLYHSLGVWIELTTLLIPDENDTEEELRQIAGFIAGLDRRIPWHISRFFPHYRLNNLEPTPLPSLFRAARIGKEAGLKYVYVGNIPYASSEYTDTVCTCGERVIQRRGYSVQNRLENGHCPACRKVLDGVFSD